MLELRQALNMTLKMPPLQNIDLQAGSPDKGFKSQM